MSTIWTIGEPLLTFLSGPLLRLRLLVASFSPLRVYLYPTATIGPVDALVDSSLFQDKVRYFVNMVSLTYHKERHIMAWATSKTPVLDLNRNSGLALHKSVKTSKEICKKGTDHVLCHRL